MCNSDGYGRDYYDEFKELEKYIDELEILIELIDESTIDAKNKDIIRKE